MLSDHSDDYTLHADTCTSSRVITYQLDLSSSIHAVVLKEEKSTTIHSLEPCSRIKGRAEDHNAQ